MATSKCCRNISKNVFKTHKLAAIFFDLDNTLIPTRRGDEKACLKMIEILEQQHGLTHEDAEKTTATFLQSFRICPDNAETSLDSWRSYLWTQALPGKWKYLNEKIYQIWLQLRYRYLALTPDYENILKRLRENYLLALITNGPSNAQWEKINKLNLSHYFDCILVSSDLPWGKPNPNIFLAACNYLNVKPQECVMIGDKLETDIKGGKDAQLGATIWIPLKPEHIGVEAKPEPDLILPNLNEMINYFEIPASSQLESTATKLRRHSQTSVTSMKKSSHYRRVVSLPEIDCGSENSSDGS